MYPAPTSAPSPDATPVPIGRRIARKWVAIGIVFAAIDLIGVFIAIRVVTDPARVGDPLISLATGLILAVLFGCFSGLCLRHARRRRNTAIITDYAGLWLTDGDAHAVVPWNSVAAIGLHESVVTQSHSWPNITVTAWSIDVRLHHPIDRDDPLLDRMVLPADPPRYMIHLPRGAHIDAMAAVRARVPELWLSAPESD